ncbi:MAG: alpha/beta hydrolase domain-containing protein [Sphingorhabdus sp.]
MTLALKLRVTDMTGNENLRTPRFAIHDGGWRCPGLFSERGLLRGVAIAGMLAALTFAVGLHAQIPSMPTAISVPPTSQPPLSSALRPGTEFSDLAKAGYVEEEYYLSGVAPAITAAGDTLLEAPYVTRILVRRPKEGARFNGTVIIEPFSWFGERAAGWILTRDYLLRKGYAYVGYTLNINKPGEDPKFPPADQPVANPETDPNQLYTGIVNFDFMRRFDYTRYAPLGAYYDPVRFLRGGAPDPFVPQSQAIGAQLALLLKTNDPNGPMKNLRVDRVYVNSWAVTAQVWMDYLDQGRHQAWRMPDGRPLIDAYMTGRMAYGEVGGDVVRVPRKMPSDVPFVTVYSQSELMHDVMEKIALPPDTDHPKLRYYEVTGMPHLRKADLGTSHREYFAADVGKGDDPRCQTVYDEPVEVIVAALLDGMDKWTREAKPMPKAPRVTRKGSSVVRETSTGNMIGGVRPPWIQIPTASYLTEQEASCGLVYDTKIAYDAQKLRKLYGSYDAYMKRFEAAKMKAVKQGYLLLEDLDQVKPTARAEDFEQE